MSYGVLIIEDEATLAKNMRTYLRRHGYDVHIVGSRKEGHQQVESFKPDVVLLDLQLPDGDGFDILSHAHNLNSQIKVIVMTAHGDVRRAIDAMKAGAYDYLSKPVVLSELKILIDKAVEQHRLEDTLSYYREREASRGDLASIVGNSKAVRALKERIRQLIQAEQDLKDKNLPAVLITGETGTGKELVARALHYNGSRRNQPFVEVNCAAIPSTLLEAELFGYEQGAFTDAKGRKPGLFEAADGGTLFLNEIGDIELVLQAKLLQALEMKVVRRLGSLRDKNVDVRITSATNQPLETLMKEGKFRADLYFRLCVIKIELPPLRNRGEDILLLTRHFLELHCRRYGKKTKQLSPAAEQLVLKYSWPGNVRELRNRVEQLVLLSQSEVIEPGEFTLIPGSTAPCPEFETGQFTLPSQGISLQELEQDLVLQALQATSWNVTQAAKLLGLTRDALRYRMEKYNFHSPSISP